VTWIVICPEQGIHWGPFTDSREATRFAEFVTAEIDPAEVRPLMSPIAEVLNWRDHHPTCIPIEQA
jgi:hypothetical protein